ncbi:MAG: putative LPS assembly protein LptD [Bacteroidaceae bacterium]
MHLKTRITISLLLMGFFLLLPGWALAQRRGRVPMAPADSVAVDSLVHDSVAVAPKKKQPLDAPVIYEANDSIVFTQGGYAHLYGQGKVNYEKIELTADVITMNMDSSTVYATGVADTLGVMQGKPVFKDGETPYESEIMRYNFKTKKGFINNVVTQQGEGYVTSNDAKKDAEDNLYLQNGKYTTCDNHDHPHFYLALTKAKVRPKKNVVFGPAYLVVEDVALPLAIPFGFFPFSSKYSSGFIMPTYGDEMNRGFYLRDGGYYFAISDKMDLALRGEIFTKGSWGLSAQSNYNKRYKFSGNINVSYLVTKTGEKNMPDYSVSKDFKIAWTHRQDAKANPNSTFSASVNFATSSYERSNLDSYYNPNLYAQNTKTSSVSYSRTFAEAGVTLSGTFNIAQTMRDSSIAVTLPSLNISMSKKFPFRRKKRAGAERWYEKISIGYTGQLDNRIHTKDNLLFKSNLIKDWNNGMKHNVPVSATFQLFKYINVVPSFNYNSRWYTSRVKKDYDPVRNDVVAVDTTYGFYRVYDYSASISMNTKLYIFCKPWKKLFGEKMQMIRHVLTPSVSLSGAPDFGSSRYGYYKTVTYTDSEGEVRTREYSPYEGAIFSYPGKGKQGSVSFSLSDNIEMKVKSDKDSTGIRKISLIDDISASMSYNFAAKTRPWSDLSMSLRMKLTKNYTLNLSTSFATYAYQFNEQGNVVVGDRTEWSYGRFGRFQGMGTSFSYTFNNETWKKWFGPKDDAKAADDGEQDRTDEKARTQKKASKKASVDDDGYMPFKMPWSFSLSYSFNIRENTAKPIHVHNMRYPYRIVHTLSGSGNLKIANRWNMTFSTSYDFDAHKIAQTTMTITRDLHCFTMSCSISPVGMWKSYNFSIRANSSMLADALKWDKRNNSNNSNVKWY